MSKSKMKELEQKKMVTKYRLGRMDRTFLIFRGFAGSTGVFNRKREENSLNKLIRLGLIVRVPVRSNCFDYVLTEKGWEISAKIISN
jgi:hypothetical protein